MTLFNTTRGPCKTTLLGCAFSLPFSIAHAASSIEHITVNGSRLDVPAAQLAVSRSVLTEQDIRASGAIQLHDLLRGLPGVSLAQSGSPGALTEVRLRGSESNHLLVLIDGVVANDIGQGSLLDLAHLTTKNIARVELLRGPQSALWGSGAIGGVLSITTRSATQTEQRNSLSAHAGMGERNSYQAGLNLSARHRDLTFRSYVDLFETDGDNVARVGNETDGYENVTAGVSIHYALNRAHQVDWILRTSRYENNYDGIDSATTGLPADSDNVTEGSQITSRLRWRYAPDSSDYTSTLSWQFHEDDNDNHLQQQDLGGSSGRRQQLTWLNRFTLTDDWQLAGGLDYLHREFEQRGPINFGDPNQRQHDTTTAAFAELAGDLSQAWHTSLSVRYDDNSEFDNAVSYRAGLTWDVSAALSLFASHGQAVKTPTFTERFGYYPGSFIGNPALDVESSREWELGLRASFELAELDVSLFDTKLDNEILGYVFVPELGAATARNASSVSTRRGLEASLHIPTDLASIRASYTYLDAEQQSGENALTELRRARHQGSLSLRSDLGTQAFSLYAKLSYTGSRQDIFYPPFPQPADRVALRPYTLASVNLSYQLTTRWQLALRVDNALDTDYEDIVGYAGERRRAMFTVSFTH